MGSAPGDDAGQQLVDAIDFGELAAQHAPAGDAIFRALERARALRDEGATDEEASAAASAIFDAAANIRNDPEGALPKTLWYLPTSGAPWGYIAAAGGVALVAFFTFKGGPARGRRRRRR